MRLLIISKKKKKPNYFFKKAATQGKGLLWLTVRVQSITEGRHGGRSMRQLVTMNLYSRCRQLPSVLSTLIPMLKKQRQAELFKLEDSLVYMGSSRSARTT